MKNKKQRAQNSIGKKFNRLLILEVLEELASGGRKKVKCLCDCGKETIKVFTSVATGHTKSCGCLNKETAIIAASIAKETMLNTGKWNKDPKIKTAKHVYAHYKDGDLSFDDFLQMSQQNCYYCGCPPSNCYNWYVYKQNKGFTQFRIDNGYFTYNGLDRIDNNKGHYKNNVVTCCYQCNISKLDYTQPEFFQWVEKVYLKHFNRK